MPPSYRVYLEEGTKRVFACALDWPGWVRSGKDQDGALQALVDYGPRYAKALGRAAGGFEAPTGASALEVVERVMGNATTDFGAPGVVPKSDGRPMEKGELDRLVELLEACWRHFDRAAGSAAGMALRKGPRGGGRELDAIVDHVLGADRGYLSSLGGTFRNAGDEDQTALIAGVRGAVLDALSALARGEPPALTRRSKKPPWPPRYGVRRVAWHALDHAWEIEDRAT